VRKILEFDLIGLVRGSKKICKMPKRLKGEKSVE
jgi:hypothetical protein